MKCAICSKNFYNERNPEAKTCSRSCNAKLVAQERRKKFKPPLCKTCGKECLRESRRQYCSNACSARARWGQNNHRWKGGVRKHSEGYVYRKADFHPNADKEGYVLEHRLIMEGLIGRLLTKKEVVHHINGIKNDNRPENLELLESQSHHLKDNHVGQDGWFGRKKN